MTVPPEAITSISSWEAVDLRPVLEGKRVTPEPSAGRRDDGVFFFYPARIHAAVGETESMKSWFASVTAAQELRDGRHVIYIDFEDTPEMAVERLRALGVPPEQIEAKFTYIQPDGPLDDIAELVLEELLSRRGSATVAYIDGVTEAMTQMGLSPDKGPDVAAFYGGYPKWLARTGAAVILIDHVTKSTENRGRWAIGSERKLSGITGAAYVFEVLAPFGHGRTGKVKIAVSKDRPGHVRQHEGAGKVIALMELRSWADGGVTASLEVPEPAGVDGTFRPTFLMEKLSRYITENPGLTTNALRSGVGGKNDSKQLALELLVNEGYIEVESGPNRARLHTSRRPFVLIEGGAEDDDS